MRLAKRRSLLPLTMSLLLTMSMAVPALGGVGGAGGGPRAGQMVTVEVCGGEGGECRQVTYEVREASKPEAVECTVLRGEEGAWVPCPETYGVPKWLERLNHAYGAKTIRTRSNRN